MMSLCTKPATSQLMIVKNPIFDQLFNDFLLTGVIHLRRIIESAFLTHNLSNVLIAAKILSDIWIGGHISEKEYEDSMIYMTSMGFNLPEMMIYSFASENFEHVRILTNIVKQLNNDALTREYLQYIKACFPKKFSDTINSSSHPELCSMMDKLINAHDQ